MIEVVYAPWSEDQVASLNDYQESGVFHPFTCGSCRDADPRWPSPDEHLLVATAAGWVCPTCDNTQNWAHAFMVDRVRWEALRWPEASAVWRAGPT